MGASHWRAHASIQARCVGLTPPHHDVNKMQIDFHPQSAPAPEIPLSLWFFLKPHVKTKYNYLEMCSIFPSFPLRR